MPPNDAMSWCGAIRMHVDRSHARTQRNGGDPDMRMNWLGFRCARDVEDGELDIQRARNVEAQTTAKPIP